MYIREYLKNFSKFDILLFFSLLILLLKVSFLIFRIIFFDTFAFTNYDFFYLLEGSKNLIDYGIPYINYWPNSSSGLDIFAWDKSIQFYFLKYFIFEKSFYSSILIYDSVFKIINLILVFYFLKNLINTKISIVFIAILLIDNSTQFIIFTKQYYSIQFSFFLISILFISKVLNNESLKLILFTPFISFFSFIGIFWFLPTGLLFLLSVIIFFLFEFFFGIKNKIFFKFIIFYSICFVFFLTIFAIFFIDVESNFILIKKALSVHLLFNNNSLSLYNSLSTFINFLFPISGPSLFPGLCLFFIFYLISNTKNFYKLKIDHIFRILISGLISSLILIVITPDNIYFERLSFLFPFILLFNLKLFNDNGSLTINKNLDYFYILSFLLIVTLLFQIFLNLFDLYHLKIIFFLLILFLFFFLLFLYKTKKLYFDYNIRFFYLLIFIFFFILGLLNIKNVYSSFNTKYISINLINLINEDIKKNISIKNESSYIVSNYPLLDISNTFDTHLIQSYKGLINGVKKDHADLFVIVNYLDKFPCKINSIYKYGLYSYKVNYINKLNNNLDICYGSFYNYNSKFTINLDSYDDIEIINYFKKRNLLK